MTEYRLPPVATPNEWQAAEDLRKLLPDEPIPAYQADLSARVPAWCLKMGWAYQVIHMPNGVEVTVKPHTGMAVPVCIYFAPTLAEAQAKAVEMIAKVEAVRAKSAKEAKRRP